MRNPRKFYAQIFGIKSMFKNLYTKYPKVLRAVLSSEQRNDNHARYGTYDEEQHKSACGVYSEYFKRANERLSKPRMTRAIRTRGRQNIRRR